MDNILSKIGFAKQSGQVPGPAELYGPGCTTRSDKEAVVRLWLMNALAFPPQHHWNTFFIQMPQASDPGDGDHSLLLIVDLTLLLPSQ